MRSLPPRLIVTVLRDYSCDLCVREFFVSAPTFLSTDCFVTTPAFPGKNCAYVCFVTPILHVCVCTDAS